MKRIILLVIAVITALIIGFFVFVRMSNNNHETALQEQQNAYEEEKQVFTSVIEMKRAEISVLQEKNRELEQQFIKQARQTALYKGKYSDQVKKYNAITDELIARETVDNIIDACDSVIVSLDNQLTTCSQYTDRQDTIIGLKDGVIDTQRSMLNNCERNTAEIVRMWKSETKKRNAKSFWTGVGIGALGATIIFVIQSLAK